MKVLIISHNPISTFQNMGKTFLSLFSSFEKNELCQLYIYPTIPDTNACSSYFRITDREVANSFFGFRKTRSRCIKDSEINTAQHLRFENDSEEAFLKKRTKSSLTLLCRDILWALSPWYNKNLKKWLEQEKPTCIFLAPGRSKFIYNIALRISKKLDIDIYSYICDDYYLAKNSKGLVSKLHSFLLKKKIKKTLTKSKAIITICDELTTAYKSIFKTDLHTISTGSTYKKSENKHKTKELDGLTFMGTIGCGRADTLAFIGETLDELNKENKTDHRLFLYTAPLSEDISEKYSKIKSIRYMGFVTGEEFQKAFENASVHLHVESFEEEFRTRVRYSVSTKIPDLLSSGKCFFAYGPEDVASIGHLIRNNCAIVATSPCELKGSLQKIFSGTSTDEITKNALKTAEKYHSCKKNSLKLYCVLSGNCKQMNFDDSISPS